MTESGATWLVQSEEEFAEALKAVLVRGERKEEGRNRLIERVMHKNDGQAAERIALTLARLVGL